MMTTDIRQFTDLESLATRWGLPTERARMEQRLLASMGELQEVYDKVMPRLESLIAHLNNYPLGAIPPEAQAMEYLTYATVEASLAVERFKQPTVPDSFDARRFLPLHE